MASVSCLLLAGLFLCGAGLTVAYRSHSVAFSQADLRRRTVSDDELRTGSRSERQTALSCENHELRQRLAEIQCDADYLNELRALDSAECSYPITFRLAPTRFTFERGFPECGRDNKGFLCGVHASADLSLDEVADNVHTDCLAGGGNTNCSNRCRTGLQNFADRFDCCIHSLINPSSQQRKVLTPQLWEDCGETRPEPCGNAPAELPPLNSDVSCDYACTFRQSLALFCKHQVEDVIRVYQDCGDTNEATRTAQMCSFNDRGDLCGVLDSSTALSFFLNTASRDLSDTLRDIYDKCIPLLTAENKCPSECREALSQAKETFGCCLNNLNSTLFTPFFRETETDINRFATSYDLWSSCVVEPPAPCELPSDTAMYDSVSQCGVCTVNSTASSDGTLALAVGLGVSGLVVLLVLIALVPLIIYCCYRRRYIIYHIVGIFKGQDFYGR